MKLSRKFLTALVAFCFTAVAAFAADASPAGTWKWTQAGRQGGQGTERSLVLEYKGGALTGTLKGATMALHSTVGFGLSALAGWSVGVALDAFGGAGSTQGWLAGFAVMASGVALGPLALWWSRTGVRTR